MFKYWEDAAEQVIREIYELKTVPTGVINATSHLAEIRQQLERHISAHWTQTPGDEETVRENWKIFGSSARALGRELGFFDKFDVDYAGVHAIVCRKQRDYGHENISRFGRVGLMVRLHDKVARLENLLGSSLEPGNESVEDNVLDLVGYACIGMMWEEKTFLLACYDTTVAERPGAFRVSTALSDVFTKMGFAASL